MLPGRAAKRQLILLALAAILLLCYFRDVLTMVRVASDRSPFRTSKDPGHFDEPELELVVAATRNEDIIWLDSSMRGWLKNRLRRRRRGGQSNVP